MNNQRHPGGGPPKPYRDAVPALAPRARQSAVRPRALTLQQPTVHFQGRDLPPGTIPAPQLAARFQTQPSPKRIGLLIDLEI